MCIVLDNSIPVYGFSYVNGTSSFSTIVPSVGIGFNISDGETKFTFASLPGDEIISSGKIRVGKFLIKTKDA